MGEASGLDKVPCDAGRLEKVPGQGASQLETATQTQQSQALPQLSQAVKISLHIKTEVTALQRAGANNPRSSATRSVQQM